ncbi:MAG: arginine repressor [Acidimicrobiia bacterium]|nr:arginine repressor [Acidimicrobiia bacterium]
MSGDGVRLSKTLRLSKTQRQHRIARLLENHNVSNQGQLVDLLAADGVTATQATVSRDLEDLGAIKVRVAGGEPAYAIPELPTEQTAPENHLRRVLGDWVVEAEHSHNLVILRTPPGSAHVVGSALDRSSLAGLLGTVAGDDTVLCVASETVGGATLSATLRDLAGLSARKASSPKPQSSQPHSPKPHSPKDVP